MDGGPLPADAASEADVALPVSRTCADDELRFRATETDGRSFTIAVDGNDVALLYLGVGCDGVGLPRDPRALLLARFATTGPAQADAEPVDDSCSSMRQPTLLTRAPGDVAAYVSIRAPDGIALAAATLGSERRLVHETALPTLEGDLAAALLGRIGRPSVAFVSESSVSQAEAGSTISVWQREQTSEALPAAALHHVTELALVQPGQSESATLLWVSDRVGQEGVYLRALDGAGRGSGEVVPLTRSVGARSAVAAAAQATGAGIVYTEPTIEGRHELRFRKLSADGKVGAPVQLVEAGLDVAHPAIAAYRNGFAIAYRWLGGALNRQSRIRLLFVDEQGRVGGERAVSDAPLGGSAVRVLTARDGRLIVAWDAQDDASELEPAGAASHSIHVMRPACF